MTRTYSSILAKVFFLLIGGSVLVYSQGSRRDRAEVEGFPTFQDPPRLVVGIVVDQMRFDYLTRFWDQYGDGGFRRMVEEGFNCRDHHFSYAPTSTGPGHASVYTGTTPSMHGIVGNSWYDKAADQQVYCVGDSTQASIGSTTGAGQHSPHRLEVTTITDQLRLHHQMRAKVLAISLKDRGSVLPGGHLANAAYWFEGGASGRWISSSFYMDELPQWVREFNASGAADRYKRIWEPLEKNNAYAASGLDNTPYESPFKGAEAPVFPHDLPTLWEENGGYDILRPTPFGNSLTLDFALEAIKAEELGSDNITDFLAVSFSSTDYVGHKFGVNSKEVQDTYLRLDRDLTRLLDYLDKNVGEGDYTVFLTADHGAGHVAGYLRDLGVPAGYLNTGEIQRKFREYVQFTFGTLDIIRRQSNNQIFLDHQIIANLGLSLREVQDQLAEELMRYEGIYQVFTSYQLSHSEYRSGLAFTIQNGYHPKRSGDLLIVPAPESPSYAPTGSTHGSPHIYDTHVPLIFFGKGVRKGELMRRTYIRDISPTLAVLLGIAYPNGATGLPISEVLE